MYKVHRGHRDQLAFKERRVSRALWVPKVRRERLEPPVPKVPRVYRVQRVRTEREVPRASRDREDRRVRRVSRVPLGPQERKAHRENPDKRATKATLGKKVTLATPVPRENGDLRAFEGSRASRDLRVSRVLRACRGRKATVATTDSLCTSRISTPHWKPFARRFPKGMTKCTRWKQTGSAISGRNFSAIGQA